jgi:hypothetical protein
MPKGTVVIYFSRLGAPQRAHQNAMLTVDAKAIASLKRYDFGGHHDAAKNYDGHVYFVPDDTLLSDEARSLRIEGPDDLYGGIVPYPFVKTKSITHPLVDNDSERPNGWSAAFAERVRGVVLPGYTAFSSRDARLAASRMLSRGQVRVKEPLEAGGRGQTLVTTTDELDALLDRIPSDDIARYGLVLEHNLNHVTTLSVGHITIDGVDITYYGKQRAAKDNDARKVYGGSDLVCVRGGWDAMCRVAMADKSRLGVMQAKVYDAAMSAYPGFVASRRNYDVGQGIDEEGQRRSGVLESSWRVGGATGAELMALREFIRDPSIHLVETSHVEEFGEDREAPRGAVVHFQGDDPQLGPMLRYTIVTRIARSKSAI